MKERLRSWLEGTGANESTVLMMERAIILVAVAVVAVVAHFVFKRIVLNVVKSLIRRSRTAWDDELLKSRTFDWLAHAAPGVVIYILGPLALTDWPAAGGVVRQASVIYIAIAALLAANSLLDGFMDIYRRYDVSRRVHIRSFVQLLKLVIFLIGAIFILSQIMDRSPLVFLSGLGAMTAVLLLIFRDTILGLVAGVQLTANDMVRRGDWISMPKYGADGDVLDVTLTTVKVQNWDKTITTIPTYALISDAFTNWRGMQESGGRRIKRSISIDMSSIRICTDEDIQRFEKFAYISEYVQKKQREVSEWNEKHGYAKDTFLINGRRLTNIGTFRAYVEAYLRNHPSVNQEMTLIVRQLPPTEHGLPIELYVFSKDQRWAYYEAIQADLFDHVIAVVSEFGLRVFQSPSGMDVSSLGRLLASRGDGEATRETQADGDGEATRGRDAADGGHATDRD